MPYAKNPIDGIRTYFEDEGGSGPPVILYSGLTDSLESSRTSGLAKALSSEFRLIYADHRGHGRSEKPHDPSAYALRTRVADVIVVLDELGIKRAHFIGFSWGARLGFAIGEHAPERVSSLVLCGNQPYAWDTRWPIVQVLYEALPALKRDGMAGFIESVESSLGTRLPESERTMMLDNDPAAIAAAWRSIEGEGSVSQDLTKWKVPCLIYAGSIDDMHDSAERAASEIPDATFLSLAGRDHFTVLHEVDLVLPHVLNLLRGSPVTIPG
jgi:pimeloyl-ACP methyl ester carboxylesterase